jgi:hypothetical protein
MRAAPNPRTLTGWSGASPHVLRFLPAGFPPVSRLPAGFFPFPRLPLVSLRPAFSGSVPSAVARFRSPSVSLRGPFPLSDLHGSAAARRFRRRWSRAAGTKVTSNAAPPSLDRAIRPHSTWAAAGHDGMPPQNRLLRAAASAGHRRPRTAQIGGSLRERAKTWVALCDGLPVSLRPRLAEFTVPD